MPKCPYFLCLYYEGEGGVQVHKTNVFNYTLFLWLPLDIRWLFNYLFSQNCQFNGKQNGARKIIHNGPVSMMRCFFDLLNSIERYSV